MSGTSAEVYLHGAHVVSFIPAGAVAVAMKQLAVVSIEHRHVQEVIFVSREAVFQPPKAIRGGIPVCWPQFNDMGPLSSHGFARNTKFTVKEQSESRVVMQLTSADVSIEGFPSGWTLLMTVVVSDDSGGMLKQTMACVNNGSEDVRTTQALHSYYRVSAVGSVSVRGLQGTPYLDNLASRATTPGATEAVTFAEEVDRIYINAGSEIVLCDGGGGREIVIAKEGFDDIVVWNPWVDKAKKFVDFGDEEYNSMLCIEPANAAKYVAGETVAVTAGETWTASQSVYVRQL